MADRLEDIGEYWYQFICQVLYSLPPFYISSSGRKYVFDATMDVPGPAWERGFPFTMSDLGYRGEKSKMSQLKRIYLNKGALEEARKKLMERAKRKTEFTSVAVSTMAARKDKRSQGHCMVAIVVTHKPPQTFVTVYYRITEVVQKFGADLVFLSREVFPQLIPENLCPLKEVRFRFANAYFSPLFLPILYRYVDPSDFLAEMGKRLDLNTSSLERALFRSCCRAAILPLIQKNPDHYKYRMRRRMHLLSMKAVEARIVDSNRLWEFFTSRPDLNDYVGDLASRTNLEDEEEDDD